MQFAIHRRAGFLAAILSFSLVAAGCAGVREQTQWSADRTRGVSATAGDVEIRNALVVADADNSQATLMATFANRGDNDELVTVRIGDATGQPDGGPLTIPGGGFATLSPDGAGVDVRSTQARPGRTIEIEFIFAAAPRATVNALVQSADGQYAGALER